MSKYYISVVDAHVAGEPLRLVTGGPKLKGNTILEKMEYMQKHYDFLRTAIMLEPRGHADMFGAVMTEPTDPRADMGIIFIDGGRYYSMCGHGAMAIGTIAVELGYIPVQEPVTKVVLETQAGLVSVLVDVKDGHATGVTLQGVPSFLYRSDVEIEVFGKEIRVDIAYGGNFFALVDISQLGLEHSKEYLAEFIKYGIEIREKANEKVKVQHPEFPHINVINDILFCGEPRYPGDTYKSLVFLGEAQLDRSPCGTGTSARMAALYTKGILKKEDVFYHESIIGTCFEGRIGEEVTVGDFKAIIPLIKSKAFLTGTETH